jgi:hypothetical protein
MKKGCAREQVREGSPFCFEYIRRGSGIGVRGWGLGWLSDVDGVGCWGRNIYESVVTGFWAMAGFGLGVDVLRQARRWNDRTCQGIPLCERCTEVPRADRQRRIPPVT